MVEIGQNLAVVIMVAIFFCGYALSEWFDSWSKTASEAPRKRQEATPPEAKGSTLPRRVICAMCYKEGPDGDKCSHCGMPFMWSWRGPNPHA